MSRFEWFVRTSRQQGLLLLLLILAAGVRIWTMPYQDEIRDMDEIGYISGGLLVWEGLSPGLRVVPAGPQTWIGWFWIASKSAWDFLKQPHSTPKLLKPFAAIDQALFDTYADLGPLRHLILWISLGVAIGGVVAGYRLGAKYGGEAGGLLIGALVALLPIYVEFAGISKSCSDSWMLGIAAISCAATLGRAPVPWVSGILLGLAVASRIDMLMLAPLVIWALWDNLGTEGLFAIALRTGFTSALTLLIAAPWLITAFVGTLRTIAMARVLSYLSVDSPRFTTLKELTWEQGFGPLLLATLAGFIAAPPAFRMKKWSLAALTLLLVSTMFIGGHYYPMRYHGVPLIAILTAAALAIGGILNRLAGWQAIGLSVCLLVLPTSQSIHLILSQRSLRHTDHSTEWIEKHVPSGTIIYFDSEFACRSLLPTPEAADAIWRQVANDQAWRTKLEEGFQRFSLSSDRFPRAMSEDNLCMDRARSRRWFILGGGATPRPRYDLRPLEITKTFGLHTSEGVRTFKETGGILIWRTAAHAVLPRALGEPFMKWVNPYGNGTLLFISPDVHDKLLN